MGGIGDWISDRLGLKAPKVTQPTLDPGKAQLNQDLIKQIQNMLSGWVTKYSAGVNSGGGTPFTFRPTYQPKTLSDLGVAENQGKITPIGQPNTAALDLYSTAGNLLGSGGYDPAGKALAYEQITRGFDENMNKDLQSLKEMFGSRGILKSSAALGKIAENKRGYGTAKGNAIGQVALADLDKANAARVADIDQQNALDLRNWTALQQVLGNAGTAGGGSPFTPQSELDYQNSLNKRNAWDQRWATIIDAAGKFA